MSLTLLRPSLYFLPGLPYRVVGLRNALVAQVNFFIPKCIQYPVYSIQYIVYNFRKLNKKFFRVSTYLQKFSTPRTDAYHTISSGPNKLDSTKSEA